MNVRFVLNSATSFTKQAYISQEDSQGVETRVDITGWDFKGTVIVSTDLPSLNKDITGTITDAVQGEYEFSISDVDRDALLNDYPERVLPNGSGFPYEFLYRMPDNTGGTLFEGTLAMEMDQTSFP